MRFRPVKVYPFEVFAEFAHLPILLFVVLSGPAQPAMTVAIRSTTIVDAWAGRAY